MHDRALAWLRRRRYLDERPAEDRSNEPAAETLIDALARLALAGGTFVSRPFVAEQRADEDLEQHQAFGALAHPGYKHFVRLRVRRDGTQMDGWVLGRVDPLGQKDQVVLVDHFTWQNPSPTGGPSSRAPRSRSKLGAPGAP